MDQTIKKIACPNCGGRMLYDISRRRVVCQFCGCIKTDDGSYAVAPDYEVTGVVKGTALYGYDNIKSTPLSAQVQNYAPVGNMSLNSAGINSAICSSCGANLIFSGNDMQTTCPFCGSVHVNLSAFSGNAPAGIIPFKVDALGVENALRFPIGNNILVPKAFKPLVSYDKYKAVYLPLWVVSTDVSINFEARYGNKPNNLRQRTGGTFTRKYTNIPFSASAKYSNTLAEQLDEFSLAGAQPFSPEYLAGVPAERCDVSFASAWPGIEQKLQQMFAGDITDKITSETGCAVCEVTRMEIHYGNQTCKSILVPLWINTVEYKGNVFFTSINGETGIYGGGYPTIYGTVGHPTYFK